MTQFSVHYRYLPGSLCSLSYIHASSANAVPGAGKALGTHKWPHMVWGLGGMDVAVENMSNALCYMISFINSTLKTT